VHHSGEKESLLQKYVNAIGSSLDYAMKNKQSQKTDQKYLKP